MDVLYTARDLPDTLVRGYHYWAIPMVSVIRRNKLVCNIFEYLTIKRAEEIIGFPIKYEYKNIKMTIGAKRNYLTKIATHKICANLDTDDMLEFA